MKYLITTIKDIEDILTPSLIAYDDDLLFNSFAFSKFEKQFRSCMKFRRIETFGEDYEKFPISFEEFNPKSKFDKFYGMDFEHLNKIIEMKEFNIDLIQYLNGREDSFVEDITDQLPNPSEAEFKMFLHNCLKNLQNSHEFLVSLEIKNNAILNLVKDELIESHKRALEKTKITFPVYNEIINLNVFGNKNLNVSNVATENNSTINLNENPFPRIFLDNDSFMFFEEYKNKFCTNNKFPLADFSFVFRMMQKEGNIFDDVTEKSFRNFLTDNYGINFEKLKTYEYSVTEKKIQLYNLLKK